MVMRAWCYEVTWGMVVMIIAAPPGPPPDARDRRATLWHHTTKMKRAPYKLLLFYGTSPPSSACICWKSEAVFKSKEAGFKHNQIAAYKCWRKQCYSFSPCNTLRNEKFKMNEDIDSFDWLRERQEIHSSIPSYLSGMRKIGQTSVTHIQKNSL